MDIISYQKGMKAKKALKTMRDRLGLDGTESGLDVADVHPDVKTRLEELEKKRYGIYEKEIKISPINSNPFETTIDLGEDAIEFIKMEATRAIRAGYTEDLVPAMTGYSSDVGTVIESGFWGTYDARGWRVFGNGGDWAPGNGGSTGYSTGWVGFKFNQPKKIERYSIGWWHHSTPGMAPRDWYLQASNDGVNWINLDRQTGQTWPNVAGDAKAFNITNTEYYTHYRINITASSGAAYVSIQELEFMEATPSEELPADISEFTLSTSTWSEDYVEMNPDFTIASKFNREVKVKVEEIADIGSVTIRYLAKPLHLRVSEMETNTAINLNKHNLQVNAVLNKNKFKHTEMVFDDFADATGVDQTKSSGYVFDSAGRKIKLASGADQAEVVMTAEETSGSPNFLMLSSASNNVSTINVNVDESKGIHTDAVATGEVITLRPVENGHVVEEGSWESETIDMGSGWMGSPKVTFEKVTNQNAITEDIMPKMTGQVGAMSDGAQVEVTVSTAWPSYYGWYAFDENQTNGSFAWCGASGSAGSPSWLQIDFKNKPRIISGISLMTRVGAGHADPKNFNVLGSNDGTNWDTVYSKMNEPVWGNGEKREYQFSNTKEYRYYRLHLLSYHTNNGSDYPSIQEMELFSPPELTNVDMFVAVSNDGVNFTNYQPLNVDGTLPTQGRYVKIKGELETQGQVTQGIAYSFDSTESTSFEVNDKIVMDGEAKLQTSYKQQMTVDESFSETGNLLKTPIDKLGFVTIEKIEVK